MIRRPPRSTLFPSTTLSRSAIGRRREPRSPHAPNTGAVSMYTSMKARSEEHTSELQSRLHLVCRLLLEKKNTDTTAHASRDLDCYPGEPEFARSDAKLASCN